MFFRRFYEESLSQASYLVGCEECGEAIAVDANRNLTPLLAAADAEGLRITRVTETHVHADFVSGSRELVRATGAALLLSAEGGRDWQYAFAAADGAALLNDGDAIGFGHVRLDVLHTPGHTPEHLSFLVTDRATANRPVGLLSGDFVFVGDVGRPDLLEKVAGESDSKVRDAVTLFHSLERFRTLPDYVQLWPGHGAGSACGKALGAMPQSTIGYERIANWGVVTRDRDAFVRGVLEGQPDPPPYFARMKRLNRDGPPVLALREPSAPRQVSLTAGRDAFLLDIRVAPQFAAAHVPGSINIPIGRFFTTWAGWLVPPDRELLLIAEDLRFAAVAVHELALIGFDRVIGWVEAGGAEVRASASSAERVEQVTVAELAARLPGGNITVLDVRNTSEWEEGRVPGALHIPLGQLEGRIAEIPASQPVVVHCQGGTRSAIAASVLLANGVTTVSNLDGGFREWVRAGKPVARD